MKQTKKWNERDENCGEMMERRNKKAQGEKHEECGRLNLSNYQKKIQNKS